MVLFFYVLMVSSSSYEILLNIILLYLLNIEQHKSMGGHYDQHNQVVTIEDELSAIGENQKQLEVSEEKARRREEKYQVLILNNFS